MQAATNGLLVYRSGLEGLMKEVDLLDVVAESSRPLEDSGSDLNASELRQVKDNLTKLYRVSRGQWLRSLSGELMSHCQEGSLLKADKLEVTKRERRATLDKEEKASVAAR